MEIRGRKLVEIADMIVVQVGQDDVGDLAGVEANQFQRFNRAAQIVALSLGGDFGGEAGIDDIAAIRSNGGPDIIIERHRAIVRIAADEIVRSLRRPRRVADGVDFVIRKSDMALLVQVREM